VRISAIGVPSPDEESTRGGGVLRKRYGLIGEYEGILPTTLSAF
jgi:hypothetical protein